MCAGNKMILTNNQGDLKTMDQREFLEIKIKWTDLHVLAHQTQSEKKVVNWKLGQNKVTKMQHRKTKTQKNMKFMRHEKQWLTCLLGVPEREKREKEHLNVQWLKIF